VVRTAIGRTVLATHEASPHAAALVAVVRTLGRHRHARIRSLRQENGPALGCGRGRFGGVHDRSPALGRTRDGRQLAVSDPTQRQDVLRVTVRRKTFEVPVEGTFGATQVVGF